MRIFVDFEGSTEAFDVAHDETVADIKHRVKVCFRLQMSDDKQVIRSLELSYAGADLQDCWCLADVGITAGTTIYCQLKEVSKPVVHVYSVITKETLPVMGSSLLLSSPVSKLRSLVSRKLGLPVSAFTLSTQRGIRLYDCNLLSDYTVEAGDTLLMHTWGGWIEFLRSCFQGQMNKVQSHFSEERAVLRFQKRVALYVAATHGHLEMSSWLLDNGVQVQEPVGVHPYRLWCYETDHPDCFKCPIQAAVEAGQLLILKMFLSRNVLNLACRDPCGQSLLQTAVHFRHKPCVSYLVSKLYMVVSFPGFVLPMWLYVRIRSWIFRAKRRPCVNRGLFKSRVGDTLLVDGFSSSRMSRMSWMPKNPVLKRRNRVNDSSCCFPALTSAAPAPSQHLTALPQLLPPTTNKRREKSTNGNEGCGRKRWKELLTADQRSQDWSRRVPLPLSSPETRPLFISSSPNSSTILSATLESFTHLCGRTRRENAIHYLTTASTFVEKPFLQQMSVAQTLARKSVQKFCQIKIPNLPSTDCPVSKMKTH